MDDFEWMERVLSDRSSLGDAAAHEDWRVRYAAAVAMGRTGDRSYLQTLAALLEREDGRPLYDQPRASFPGSHDDTRMAEQILAVHEVFEREAGDFEREAWKCRGRVKQACLFAIGDIGFADESLRRKVEAYLVETDDVVRMAAARALGRIGDAGSLSALEPLLDVPEFCSRTEARKATDKLQRASVDSSATVGTAGGEA